MVSLLAHQVVFHFRQHRRPAAFSKFFFSFCSLPAPTELRHHLRFLIPLPLRLSRITSHPIFAAVSAANFLSYHPHDTWINYTRTLHLAKPIANLRSRPSFHAPSFRPPRRSLPRVHSLQPKGNQARAAKGHCLFGRCLGSNPDAPHRTAPHRPDTYLLTPVLLTHLVVFSVSSAPFPPIRFLVRGLRHLTITLVHPHSSIDLRRGPNPCSATLGRYRRRIEILVSPPSNPLHPESARNHFPPRQYHAHALNYDQPSIVLKPSTIHPKCFNSISRQHRARAISIDLDSHCIHTLQRLTTDHQPPRVTVRPSAVLDVQPTVFRSNRSPSSSPRLVPTSLLVVASQDEGSQLQHTQRQQGVRWHHHGFV